MSLVSSYGWRALLLFLIVGCQPASAGLEDSSDCSGQWEAWSQKPGVEGAFPDTQVSYYRYTFKVPQTSKIMFKVTGQFPNGRYTGFNIYNSTNMDSVVGIADYEINPDAGSSNPFRTGTMTDDDGYTLWMDPHDPQISQLPITSHLSGGNQNPDADQTVSGNSREIWYRIYDAKDDPGGRGNVELPRIEAFNQATGEATACPQPVSIPVPKGKFEWSKLWTLPPGPSDAGILSFVHHKGMGLYANRDTDYVAARLRLRGGRDEVTILKFRAPRSAKGIEDLARPENLDVRYWSFCIGSALTTTTAVCLNDSVATLDQDGFVTIVIGNSSIKEFTAGANFLERPLGTLPVLIYRNLIPREGFSGAFKNIPFWKAVMPVLGSAEEYAADKFIGDYAPVGKVCSVDQYKATRCQ